MITETAKKFGYPSTLVYEAADWIVLLRPDQPTLGALVVALKGSAQSMSEVPACAFDAFPAIFRTVEASLKDLFGADKFNYLTLMMIDSDVHFHVIPRYKNGTSFKGMPYPDVNWPAPPDLTQNFILSEADFTDLVMELSSRMKALG